MNELTWQSNHADVLNKYPDLIEKVWAQLQKDFSMEAMDMPDASVLTLDQIYLTLYPIVSDLIKSDFTSLSRLLYRIDVSENRVQKHMDLMPDDSAQAISTAILKREIEKVILRKQFSE